MIEPLEAVVIEDEEELVVEIPVSSTIFLERLLLRLGPDARVVSEGSFGDLASVAARRLLSRYEKP
jgi:hypothetical protein